VTTTNVARRSVAEDLSRILASPQVSRLIDELQKTRWTGRSGSPIRSMVGMALAKSMYTIPTWTRTVALVSEHPALATVIAPDGEVPSVWSCCRFAGKLREHTGLLDGCIARVVRELKARNPMLGRDVAIDASDMPAYANGQRFASKGGRERSDSEFSDPDASWGHRSAVSTRKGGGFYGYRLHLAACARTDLPLAWTVETAKANETLSVAPLLDRLHALGVRSETCAMDRGTTSSVCTGSAASEASCPLCRCGRPRASSAATTSHRGANTASGGALAPTANATRRSGAAPLASAGPRPRG
jgi:hypothetical protein